MKRGKLTDFGKKEVSCRKSKGRRLRKRRRWVRNEKMGVNMADPGMESKRVYQEDERVPGRIVY